MADHRNTHKKKKKKSRRTAETEKTITVGSKKRGFINVPTLDFPGRRTMTPREAVKTAKERGTASKSFKTLKSAVTAAKKRSSSIPIAQRVLRRAEEERTGKVIRSTKKKRKKRKK